MRGLLLLTAVGVVGVGLTLAVLALRASDQSRRDNTRRTFIVSFPRTVKADQVQAFLRTLMGLTTPRSGLRGRDAALLEVVGRRGAIEHRLRLPYGSADAYLAQLRAAVPGVSVSELDQADETFALARPDQARELRRTHTRQPLSKGDPAAVARTILASCTGLKRGETVVWSWSICGGSPMSPAQASSPSWGRLLRDLLSGGSHNETSRPLPPGYAGGLIAVTGRVGATGTTQRKSRHLIAGLIRATATVTAPGARLIPRALPSRLVAHRLATGTTALIETPVQLTAEELVGLIGWPIDGPLIPGLVLGRRPQLLASPEVPRRGRTLGDSTVGEARPVAQSLRGAAEHSLIAGPTGSGKSTLAIQLALEDIAAGRGVLVIDPKGETIAAIIARLPEEAVERTVLVDPTDATRPVPLPLLSSEGGGLPELAADNLVGLLRHRFRDLGPRSTDIITSSLYALARMPETSLIDLLRLWSDAAFRVTVAEAVREDPALRSFFAGFEAMSTAERNFVLAAPMNKIRPLFQRPIVRNVIAAPRATFTMREALAKRLVVLVSLPEGSLGAEATTLIGQVLLGRLWSAIQGQKPTSADFKQPHLVLVDEAARFVDQPTDLGDVLARARGYGVGVTLVTQSLSQFPTALRDVALNSARTKISFQTSAADARRLAEEFGPTVTPDMLQGLAAFEAIGTVSVGGAVTEPFTFTTRPLGPVIPGRAAAVRKASRQRYGVPRAEIEARFAARKEPPTAGSGPVRRRYES